MTTTSIKDAGNVPGIMATVSAAKPAPNVSRVEFKNVLDEQSNGQKLTDDNAKASEKVDKPKDAQGARETKTPDNPEKSDRIKKAEESGETTELKEDDVDASKEAVMTALAGIIDGITETFDISREELGALLEGMGLEEADLLNSESLKSVLLEVNGIENASALLTDEGLYADFNRIMNMPKEDSGVKGLSVEELGKALEDITKAPVNEVSAEQNVPVVTVEVKTEDEFAGTDETVSEDTDGIQVETMTEKTNQSGGDSRAGSGRKDDSEHSDHGAKAANAVLHNPVNDNMGVNEQRVVPFEGFTTNTQDIMRQIMDFMRVQIKPDMSNIQMQLHPENLGTLQIHVESKAGVLTANFVAQNEAVKAALESQLVQLKESFSQQGLKVEAVEVTVETHEFDSQNPNQGNAGESYGGEPKRGSRGRSLNLDSLMPNDLDALEEDDRLAAEIMAANGNTVDYTA